MALCSAESRTSPRQRFLDPVAASKEWHKRAKSRLQALQLTQDELANAVGKTQSGVNHWLAGRREPGLDDLERLARALKCTPGWLAFGEGPGEPVEAPTIDDALLEQAVAAVEEAKRAEGITLDPEQVARLAAFLYQERGPRSPSRIASLARLLRR